MVPILLYEGASGHQALGALAALRAAGLDAALVSTDALVPTHEGARIVPHKLGYDALDRAPALVLPGGDAARIVHDAKLAAHLRARRGAWTLAAGDAVRALAAAGLLEGRRVSRPPGAGAIAGTETSHARLVADGRILTSHDGDALVDLVLHYVARERGEDVAKRAAHTMGREPRTFALGADA